MLTIGPDMLNNEFENNDEVIPMYKAPYITYNEREESYYRVEKDGSRSKITGDDMRYGNNNDGSYNKPNYNDSGYGSSADSSPNNGEYQKDYSQPYQKPQRSNDNYQQNNNSNSGYQKKSNYQNKGGYDRKPAKPVEFKLYASVFIADEIPPQDVDKMYDAIKECVGKGFTIRFPMASTPAHERLQEAAGQNKETYIPWDGFKTRDGKELQGDFKTTNPGKEFTGKFVRNWSSMEKAHSIIAHNTHALTGRWLTTPSNIVLMWTADGITHIRDKTDRTGFMYTTIKIINHMGIPIVNFGSGEAQYKLQELLTNYLPLVPESDY